MKARIIITNERGRTFEGEIDLSPSSPQRTPVKAAKQAKKPGLPKLDFDLAERAFVKRCVRGLSGPKKFVLLLAYIAKGDVGKEVVLRDVEKCWNRMTASTMLDGKFNRFYSNVARENGWVATKKAGVYFLRPTWTEVLVP